MKLQIRSLQFQDLQIWSLCYYFQSTKRILNIIKTKSIPNPTKQIQPILFIHPSPHHSPITPRLNNTRVNPWFDHPQNHLHFPSPANTTPWFSPTLPPPLWWLPQATTVGPSGGSWFLPTLLLSGFKS